MTAMVELVKQLRDEWGAGVMDCRRALEQTNGNYEQARVVLREQAEAEAAKRANNSASQGRIVVYSHNTGRIGVMVQVDTETDFASRSPLISDFAHEIALQIAAEAPAYVCEDEIPPEVIAGQTQKAEDWARQAGKPERLVPRIVDGMLKKFLDQQVLLRQAYIRDPQLTIAQLQSQASASVGEKVVIRRFVRWEFVEAE